MYRDAANYKQFSKIILSNKSEISISEIKNIINSFLIDGEYFIPQNLKLPALHYFVWDNDIDHHFHELLDVGLTDSAVNSQLDIIDLITEIISNEVIWRL